VLNDGIYSSWKSNKSHKNAVIREAHLYLCTM